MLCPFLAAGFGPIVLQKSQNAVRLNFRQTTIQAELSIDVASNTPPKSPVSLSQNEVVPTSRSIAVRAAQKIWHR